MSDNTKPTRPGRWWRGWPGDGCPPWVEEIDGDDGEMFRVLYGEPVDDDGGWLAPIPSPAVCEAVARYAEAYSNGFPLVQASAETSLLSAIRAEVDGAA